MTRTYFKLPILIILTFFSQICFASDEGEIIFPNATPLSLGNQKTEFTKISLRGLNKITTQTTIFEIDKNKLSHFGNLIIRVIECQASTRGELEGVKAYIEIWDTKRSISNTNLHKKLTEENIDRLADKIFTGWIFSALPSISHLQHNAYDLKFLDCY